MAELPIIVLAFANEQEGRRYLRDLPDELNGLREILKNAERNGLCRLELLPNATLDQIFDVFTRNRDQVTILHYGGHADSGRLLLESSAVGGAPAHAAGLARFLGQCGGLQLVFLNGCSTRGQVARLLEAGVSAVIATARAIDDGMARAFAVAFYTELAAGLPLLAAYEKSRGRVLAARGDAPQAYFRSRELGDTTAEPASPDPTDDDGFPWEFRTGPDLVKRWSRYPTPPATPSSASLASPRATSQRARSGTWPGSGPSTPRSSLGAATRSANYTRGSRSTTIHRSSCSTVRPE